MWCDELGCKGICLIVDGCVYVVMVYLNFKVLHFLLRSEHWSSHHGGEDGCGEVCSSKPTFHKLEYKI